MVLACSTCDDSKQHRDFAVWMASAAPKSPTTLGMAAAEVAARCQRIGEYAAKFGYLPRHRDHRLSSEQAMRLRGALVRLAEVRAEIQDLVGATPARPTKPGPAR